MVTGWPKDRVVSNRDGPLEAHVMNADGSGQRSLTGSEER